MAERIPLFARKFVVDFIETGLAAILALTIVFPQTWGDVQEQGAIILMAVLGALISAIRRAVPGFLLWLNEKLGTTSV